MSKRPRKVAFDEEVDLAEKRRREEELYELEHEEKRGCALIRVINVYSSLCYRISVQSQALS